VEIHNIGMERPKFVSNALLIHTLMRNCRNAWSVLIKLLFGMVYRVSVARGTSFTVPRHNNVYFVLKD
jgi:hypothetical protein